MTPKIVVPGGKSPVCWKPSLHSHSNDPSVSRQAALVGHSNDLHSSSFLQSPCGDPEVINYFKNYYLI